VQIRLAVRTFICAHHFAEQFHFAAATVTNHKYSSAGKNQGNLKSLQSGSRDFITAKCNAKLSYQVSPETATAA
jgi:hypothetical protein